MSRHIEIRLWCDYDEIDDIGILCRILVRHIQEKQETKVKKKKREDPRN